MTAGSARSTTNRALQVRNSEHHAGGYGSIPNASRPLRDVPADDLLSIIADAGIPVLVLDRSGVCVFANPAYEHASTTKGELTGRRIEEIHPEGVGAERADVAEETMRSGAGCRLLGMLNGRLTLTTFRPLMLITDSAPALLCVVNDVRTREGLDAALVRSATRWATSHDWGTLSGLQPRELQVLSLIGRGMSTSEIAREMFRSEKTVEHHRSALGRKLNSPNRAVLARISTESRLHALSLDEIERMLHASRRHVRN